LAKQGPQHAGVDVPEHGHEVTLSVTVDAMRMISTPFRIGKIVVALGAAVALALTAAPASSAQLAVPPEVSQALADFSTAPQEAVTVWSQWAATAPMTYVRNGNRPKLRSNCAIDSAGVADCSDFAQVIGRGNRNMGMKKISEIITAGNRQFFRDPPLKRWTRTRTSSNPNPITGLKSRIGYSPWLPWLDDAADISTRVLDNGSVEIAASNPNPREGQAARTITRISANGLQATVQEFDQRNRVSATTRVVIKDVPAIRVPR
jgi:hypothetical protein